MTKKCARCDFEYDDAYDGCPVCARAEVIAAAATPAQPAATAARFSPSATTDYGPGNAAGALLGAVLVIMGAVLLNSISSADTRLWVGLLNPLLWAIVVAIDYDNVKKPTAPGFKIAGTAGTSKAIWVIAAFLISIIAVPMYFYERPRIRRAYETGYRPSAEGWCPDPTHRHESRYWSGSDWTAHVSDGGVVGSDPLA